MIPHNRPFINDQDISVVSEVLRSGWLAQGPQVEALENDFTLMYGGGGACACSSGTAALYLALKGLGISIGDTVAVPTYSCSALLNAVNLAGAHPMVVDVREDDFTIDFQALKRLPLKPKAVIAVHVFGAEANIHHLQEFVPLVIEDCCQSLGGGGEDERPLGNKGNAAVFSFYATKIVTCGQGGMVWDPSGEVAAWARDYRNFDCRETYEPRFNFQLTDFQAALARSQLSRLRDLAARRREIARKYLAVLPENIKVQEGVSDPGRMVYRLVLRFPDRAARDAASRHFQDNGVGTIVPVERYELLHRYLHLEPGSYPNAETLVDTTLSIPVYPALSNGEVARVCEVLAKITV